MASQILSGSSNPTYTNNTGQNVRLVINYMIEVSSMSWAGVTQSPKMSDYDNTVALIGPARNLVEMCIGKGIYSYINATLNRNSGQQYNLDNNTTLAATGGVPTLGVGVFPLRLEYMKEGGYYPVEIALAPTQTFSAVCGPYNIVVIKEDGT